MLYVPSGAGDFRIQGFTHPGRPAANFGATITPGQNTKGGWTEFLASGNFTDDCWFIMICINSNNVSSQIRDALVDIGKDPAGGTTYTTIIPNLLCGGASPYNVGAGGIWYAFPLFIKSGASLAARASVNNATVGTLRVTAILFGDPRRPEGVRRGTFVEALGVDAGNSRGTIVTPGTTSEGGWTSLGTLSNPCWWWQVGSAAADTTWQAAAIHLDIAVGTASAKKMLVENLIECRTSSEQQNNAALTAGCVREAAAGEEIWARAQSSGNVDSSFSMMAYGLGG